MYKHFLSVSSQIAFCSAPIRLDSYNACQFSCGYCYARARTGAGRDAKLVGADPTSLENRLNRIARGEISSALDEFLQRRTPIQFGGMSDPLMPIESKSRTSLKILNILKETEYPYLLSTKGPMIFESAYVDALKGADVLARFSFAGCSDKLRSRIDRGVLKYAEFILAVSKLKEKNIKVGLRLQPLIPGEEQHAVEMLQRLPSGVVDHVSAEYLKVPVSADRRFGMTLLEYFGGSVISWYQKNGTLVGNEYVLNSAYRRKNLALLREICTLKGITFGYADNDFLLLSDGNGCCSGADLHLKGAQIFESNTLGIIRKNIRNGRPLDAFEISDLWVPKHNIAQYLNSKTRLYSGDELRKEWGKYMEASWVGEWGQYSPNYFLSETYPDF